MVWYGYFLESPNVLAWLPQFRKLWRKKILQGQGKFREFLFESGKIKVFKRSQEKVKLIFKSPYLFFSLCFHCFLTFYIFLYIFIFMHMNLVLLNFVEYCSWNWARSWWWVFLLAHHVKELSIHVWHCTWFAESINK